MPQDMTTVAIETPAPANTGDLTPASLEAALRAVEPGVVLVPRWVLQNVIAADRGMGGSAFTVPHRKSHLITPSRLLEIAGEDELALPEELPNQPRLVLLPSPHERLAGRPADEVLRHYWRLLFHARIDAEMQTKL